MLQARYKPSDVDNVYLNNVENSNLSDEIDPSSNLEIY